MKFMMIVLGLALIVSCQQVDFGGNCGQINGYSFAEMDTNKDGKIVSTEFKTSAMKVQQADFRVHACKPRSGVFTDVDTDKDGQISESEFNRYP